MRLFFALWPPPEAARALFSFAQEVQKVSGGRVTAQDKIHLTLAFLGEADPAKAVRAARTVKGSMHELPIEEARYWRENQIVWAGPRETPLELKGLHERLGMALYREEFMLERRAFAAHVTLVRKARAAKFPPIPAVRWPVREFFLVRSMRSTYEPLERFALSPPA
jgi:RNA 2',3'-cyclic 3'-phosphodiesterase